MGRLAKLTGLVLACNLAAAAAQADGDPAAGEKVFRKCAACHSLKAGKVKVGPPLAGLFGRQSGSVDGFRYSKAMKSADIVWTPETLNEYLAAPRKFVPGNRMPFPGLKKPQDRADLIAYLRTTTAGEK